MRIGIFTDSFYPHVSGVSTSIDMLKNALEKMGHTVYIVAPNKTFSYDKKNRIIWIQGLKFSSYELRVAKIYSNKAMKIIEKEWKLDIIHTQTELSIDFFARKVAKKLNIPVVRTYHTLYEDYTYYVTKGHFDNFAKKTVIKLTKKFCEKRCDELIVPTEKIKRLFIDKYNIKTDMTVIPSGIDIKRFNINNKKRQMAKQIREKYHIAENDFVIGSVGRVASEKSFDKIIENMPTLIKLNNKIKFMLVGYGPQLEELKKLAKQLKVEKNIIFTGFVDYNEVCNYYHVFDVMVSFSKTETQGLTIIEGLASSKPVICIDDQSFRSMVQHNYNGFLFEKEDEFRNYIIEMINDKALYKTICMNAKNSVYSYSKEVFASRVLKVYYKALDKKHINIK